MSADRLSGVTSRDTHGAGAAAEVLRHGEVLHGELTPIEHDHAIGFPAGGELGLPVEESLAQRLLRGANAQGVTGDG
jgi:hypothetical protein